MFELVHPEGQRSVGLEAIGDPDAYKELFAQRALAGTGYIAEAMAALPQMPVEDQRNLSPRQQLDRVMAEYGMTTEKGEQLTSSDVLPGNDRELGIVMGLAAKYAATEAMITGLQATAATLSEADFRATLAQIEDNRAALNGPDRDGLMRAVKAMGGLFNTNLGNMDTFANWLDWLGRNLYKSLSDRRKAAEPQIPGGAIALPEEYRRRASAIPTSGVGGIRPGM